MRTHPRWRPFLLAPGLVALFVAVQALLALPALACGGLVAPNGSIRLTRAATLIAWHDGIEHYMTSFTYEGDVKNLGWIVPLPAVPLRIQEGGAWTLQRLSLETHPQPRALFAAGAESAAAPGVQVLQTARVEALNITVLKGSGQAVLDWCAQNGFVVTGDTRDHLLKYAEGSPLFMAVKYDTARAHARHQTSGDGAPLLITMRTPHPWVPLEVLALDGQIVHADLYFLTDQPLNISAINAIAGQSAVYSDVPGAPGLRVDFQERLTPTLYHDLSTDRNMGWVRSDSWLTYLSLDAPAEQVTYDLNVSPDGIMRLTHFGTSPTAAIGDASVLPAWLPRLPLGAPDVVIPAGLLLLLIGGLAGMAGRERRLQRASRLPQP
ncbi:MAG TPA: DUF2330 domain-containing protein [Ktedonobacterales bacterium]